MPLSAKIPVSCRGSQPIITADLTCLECELGVPLVACMHSHKQQGSSSASLPTLTVRVGRIGDTTDVTVTPTIGQPVQMECGRSGAHKNWYSAGSVVTSTPGEVTTTGGGGAVRTLSISHFSSTHAGTYTCIVGPIPIILHI